MKKRIIAIFLSVSVLCFSLICGTLRASAATPGSGLFQIALLAWQLIGVSTGQYDNAADAISYVIEGTGTIVENGWDALVNPDSPFQRNWSVGFSQICNSIQGWFDSGDIKIDDGEIELTYAQYMELYGQLIAAAPNPGLDFTSPYPSRFYSFSPDKVTSFSNFPKLPDIIYSNVGQSYACVYYSDDVIYFSPVYVSFKFSSLGNGKYAPGIGLSYLRSNDLKSSWVNGASAFEKSPDEIESVFSYYTISLGIDSAGIGIYDTFPSYSHSTDYILKFDGSNVVSVPLSEFDPTDLESGMITTIYSYSDFIQSVTGFDVTGDQELDDLTNTIPTEYNPSLTFPANPDLSVSLPNQIIVGNVPGVADLPLSEYQANIKTDIEVPSIITTKFPFCIPFDFMRFLGLLCSDPVAPVFRIPISTHPDNLDQWEGNQTIGEYLNPDNPMFEIDYEIVIDLSVIPLVQPICYTCFIVGFIFLLIHITPKMIQH